MRTQTACAVLSVLICGSVFAQDMPLTQVLIEDEGWELVSGGHKFTDGLTADEDGNLYFTDVLGGTTINMVSPTGNISVVAKDAPLEISE